MAQSVPATPQEAPLSFTQENAWNILGNFSNNPKSPITFEVFGALMIAWHNYRAGAASYYQTMPIPVEIPEDMRMDNFEKMISAMAVSGPFLEKDLRAGVMELYTKTTTVGKGIKERIDELEKRQREQEGVTMEIPPDEPPVIIDNENPVVIEDKSNDEIETIREPKEDVVINLDESNK